MSEANTDQELALRSLIALTRSHRSVMNPIIKNIQEYGMNATEFGVLELLYHKGEQPIQKIGEKVLITSGTITYVVDKLENKGYLTRKASETDRRITYASITPEGAAFMSRVFPDHAETIRQLFSVLSADEKRTLVHLLKKLGLYAEGRDK